MIIDTRLLSDIIPYEHNPRVNNHAVNAVAESIRQFGYVQPIVIDSNNVIIAGHTRYKALLQIYGPENASETDVQVVVANLDEKQANTLRIADNKVGELSEWDFSLLSAELIPLIDDYDFKSLGFTNTELKLLTGEANEVPLPEADDEKIKISIGKESITVFKSDFDAWHLMFMEENGCSLTEFLLNSFGLFPLKRRYELSKAK